jgi:hypothetical protein
MWLLKEGVAVLQKKEPLHDYKAGAMAAAAAVIQHLPVRVLNLAYSLFSPSIPSK